MASSQSVKAVLLLLSIQAAVHAAFGIRYQSYVSCDPPHRPDNGDYYGSTYRRLRYPIGTKIRFFCNNGYKLEGASQTVCKYSNRRAHWFHPSPVCRPIPGCPSLSDPSDGSVQVTGNTPGSVALYRCNSGYKLVGFALRKCSKGSWTGREPVCQAIQPCGGLGTPLSTSAGLVTCSATRQCPQMYFCHSTDHFSACCPVTPPTSTTTQRPPVTVAATTPATPFSGSGAGNGDDDDIDSSGSGSGASDQEDQDSDDWQLQQIQIIE